jgi:hypothetical protein
MISQAGGRRIPLGSSAGPRRGIGHDRRSRSGAAEVIRRSGHVCAPALTRSVLSHGGRTALLLHRP